MNANKEDNILNGKVNLKHEVQNKRKIWFVETDNYIQVSIRNKCKEEWNKSETSKNSRCAGDLNILLKRFIIKQKLGCTMGIEQESEK